MLYCDFTELGPRAVVVVVVVVILLMNGRAQPLRYKFLTFPDWKACHEYR